MLGGFLQVEEDLRRLGQELAVAWRRGRAAFVLDTLTGETPLRAAMLAALIHQLLGRWDPVEGKWPVGFWRALVRRSEGWVTAEELDELTALYRRRFGLRPPPLEPARPRARSQEQLKQALADQARRIRQALESDLPISPRGPQPPGPTGFLRGRRELR